MAGMEMEISGRQPEWGRDIGTPIAVLRLEPEDLAARGLKFERGYDDLDNVRVAWFGENIAFVRHERSPCPGTEIVVSGFRPERASEASRDLDAVLRRLSLSTRDLSWTHPDISAAPTRVASRAWHYACRFLSRRSRTKSPS